MPTRKRGARPHPELQQPPLRRFKSVQGGREVLLHVGEGDSAEALLGQSGFRLYKRNLSEPAPLALAPKSAVTTPTSPPSVSPPRMVRLPPTLRSAPPNVNMFPQTMITTTSAAAMAAMAAMATNKGKADLLPSPPLEPIIVPPPPALKRSDSDGDSGAPDEAPLNLSISRDLIRTDSAEGDVLVLEEPSVDTPQSVVRPAAIPALMPIRDGKNSNRFWRMAIHNIIHKPAPGVVVSLILQRATRSCS